jgi:hypothetical protein
MDKAFTRVNPRSLLLYFVLGMAVIQARAVEVLVNGTASQNYDAPTASDIPNWGTGWGNGNVTGWNYVGDVGSAGGVYLGNNWVITAGHVGANNFVLAGITYNLVPGSAKGITNSDGTADLTLFEIATAPELPELTIGSSAPVALSASGPGEQVAMIGYGGGKSWGLNTITAIGLTGSAEGYYYETSDFETAYGTTTAGTYSATNDAVVISGDSGGGDFSFNDFTDSWDIVGINEGVNANDSYLVQLSTYEPQIKSIISVPEPCGLLPAGLALALLPGVRRRRR